MPSNGLQIARWAMRLIKFLAAKIKKLGAF